MDVNSVDLAGFLNDNRLNQVNAILGKGQKIAGMDPALLQQLSMLRSNSAAYRKLLEAEKTGTIRQNDNYKELMSDRYFNDSYNPSTGALIKPIYSPKAVQAPSLDMAADTGTVLDSLRRLSLAAIQNSGALNQTHYDMFNHLTQAIASNLVADSGSRAEDAVAGEEGWEVVASAGGESDAIVSTAQLGQAEYAGRSYSFADLAPGGAASLAVNPDAALEVLDQAIRDIYSGKARIKGFDPATAPMLMP